MIKEFRLPDLGEGLTESEILSWKVGVGDTVSLNQVIAEVETAKAVVELPSPFAGVITALHEQPGTVVEVGKPIVSFEVPDDGGASAFSGGAAPQLPRRRGRGKTGTQPRGVRRRRRKFRPPGPAGPQPRSRWLRRRMPVEPAETRACRNPSQPSKPKPPKPARRTPPLHAARAEARQGPGRRPGSGGRHRPRRPDHAATTSGTSWAAATCRRRAPPFCSAGTACAGGTCRGRPAGDPHAHQGGPQVHGGRHGGQRVHRTACDRVPDGGRHSHHGPARQAEGQPGFCRTTSSRR